MLSLILAAVIANAPAERPTKTSASASARATVRIVSGEEVRFGKIQQFEASIVRASVIRERDGSRRNASLVEFY